MRGQKPPTTQIIVIRRGRLSGFLGLPHHSLPDPSLVGPQNWSRPHTVSSKTIETLRGRQIQLVANNDFLLLVGLHLAEDQPIKSTPLALLSAPSQVKFGDHACRDNAIINSLYQRFHMHNRQVCKQVRSNVRNIETLERVIGASSCVKNIYISIHGVAAFLAKVGLA